MKAYFLRLGEFRAFFPFLSLYDIVDGLFLRLLLGRRLGWKLFPDRSVADYGKLDQMYE